MTWPFRRAMPRRAPVPPLLPPLVTGLLSGAPWHTADERAAVKRPCWRCGAGQNQLCINGTGLPASAPCPGRGQQ